MAIRQISTILSLKDKISSPMVKVSNNVKNVTREMKRSQNQVESWKNKSIKAMDNVIKKSVKVVGAAGALAGAFAIKVGFDGLIELQEGSAKVKSIAKDSLDLKNIQKDLLKYSTATNVGVNELAETQYSAISSGVKAAESIQASVTATKLAKAGFTDANSSLKVLTSTMNTYGLQGQEAMQSISDKLLITQNLGVTTVGELSEQLGNITPIAKSAGVGIDDMLSSIASLTKGGMSTDAAVTNLKGVMTSFIKPSSEASKMAKKLGIDMSVNAIKTKGFAGVMEEIKKKTGGNTEVMGQLFGNVRALSAALALTSDTGMSDFNNTLEEMKNSAGATDEAFAIMTDTMGFKLNKFKNTSKNIFTSLMNTQSGVIGEYVDKIDNWVTNNEEKIQGWVQSIGDGITRMIEFVKSIVDFIKKHEKVITTILIFIGTLYTVIKVIGILKGLFIVLNTIWLIFNGTLMITPLGWLVLAIGAVVAIGYALYRNWDTIKEKAFELWEGIKTAFSPLGEFFKGLWEGVQAGFKSFINFFIGGINQVVGGINSVKVKVPDWVPKFGGKEFSINIPKIPEFALGTAYFTGGLARTDERGGEIKEYPSGTRIIPHDVSVKAEANRKSNGGIVIQIYGNVYGEEDMINRVGSAINEKIDLQLANIP